VLTEPGKGSPEPFGCNPDGDGGFGRRRIGAGRTGARAAPSPSVATRTALTGLQQMAGLGCTTTTSATNSNQEQTTLWPAPLPITLPPTLNPTLSPMPAPVTAPTARLGSRIGRLGGLGRRRIGADRTGSRAAPSPGTATRLALTGGHAFPNRRPGGLGRRRIGAAGPHPIHVPPTPKPTPAPTPALVTAPTSRLGSRIGRLGGPGRRIGATDPRQRLPQALRLQLGLHHHNQRNKQQSKADSRSICRRRRSPCRPRRRCRSLLRLRGCVPEMEGWVVLGKEGLVLTEPGQGLPRALGLQPGRR
jgi:hypothetical protein